MRNKPTMGNRRSIRLQEFDYPAYGAYFVTICTHERKRILHLPRILRFVEASWRRIPDHFPSVALEEIVIMPDHVHFLITILPASDYVAQGASRRAPTLPDVVRAFKRNAAREINKVRRTPGAPVWQRNYYERIVRDETELERVREYIRNNPLVAHTHETDDRQLPGERHRM